MSNVPSNPKVLSRILKPEIDVKIMENKVSSYLTSYLTNGDEYTHTSMVHPMGKFKLATRDAVENFWELYCNEVAINKDLFIGVQEKQLKWIPILVDIDIKIDEVDENGEDIYSTQNILDLITIYHGVLRDVLPGIQNEHLTCVVLEKRNVKILHNNKLKKGFHLHFPNIFTTNVCIDIHINPRVKEKLKELHPFKRQGIPDSEALFDSTLNKNWLLYGSRKPDDIECYKVTRVYNDKLQDIGIEGLRNIKLFNLDNQQLEYTKPMEWYLPRILSVIPYNDPFKLIKPKVGMTFIKTHIPKPTFNTSNTPVTGETILRMVKFASILSPNRASKFDTWIKVGWVLYNIGNGCEDAYNTWVEFSKKTKSNNFSEDVCAYEWKRMVKQDITIGSLIFMATQDNPEECQKIKREFAGNKLFKEIEYCSGSTVFSKILHQLHGEKIACVDIKKDIWYYFDNHRWKPSESGHVLWMKISGELWFLIASEYNKLLAEVPLMPLNNTEDVSQDESTKITKKLDMYRKILSKLKEATFKKNIMIECRHDFYNDKLISLLDSDPYLVGFNNGIYDLRTHSFREGIPSDYISITTGYDYVEYSQTSSEVLRVHEFLSKVFPDNNLRAYFMEYAALLPFGGNPRKKFLIFTGEGDNGKTVIINFLEYVLGGYMTKSPTSLIAGGKRTQSSNAMPELAAMKGKRFAIFQEPDKKDSLSTGVIKELTGNDSFYARGLFRDGDVITPMIKICLVCNKPPKAEDDKALWNRIRMLTFESVFTNNKNIIPSTILEQYKQKIFPRIENIEESLKGLKSAMMWMMLTEYKRIKEEGDMEEPEKVKLATLNYRNKNNHFRKFIIEMVARDDTNTSITKVMDLYVEFKDWYRLSYGDTKDIANKEEFEEYISRVFGPPVKGMWDNIRSKKTDDDEIIIPLGR